MAKSTGFTGYWGMNPIAINFYFPQPSHFSLLILLVPAAYPSYFDPSRVDSLRIYTTIANILYL